MLYAWGANNYGQLGLGYISEQEEIPKHVNIEHEFVKIIGGGGHTLALDSDGNLFVCGWNRFGQLGIEFDENLTRFTRTDVSGVVDVAAGWDFSLLLLQDGTVLSAGSNKFFQLGKVILFIIKRNIYCKPNILINDRNFKCFYFSFKFRRNNLQN